MYKFKFKPRSRMVSLPNIHGALSGRVAWELYDPKTDQVVQSGEQSNLILNQGLDLFGSTFTGNNFSGFRDYFCVGEGTSVPAITQTTLDTERVRSNSTGGFTDTSSATYDPGTKLYTGTFVINRVITFSGAQNFVLTEFGFAAGASGSLSIRELFRDAGGNPTTITDTAGKQLRMTHTLTITLTGDWTQAASTTITGVGTVTGIGSFYSSSSATVGLFTQVWAPANTIMRLIIGSAMDNPLPTHGSSNLAITALSTNDLMSNAAYVSGSYARRKTRVLSTSTGNGSISAIVVTSNTGAVATACYAMRLDTPFTKTSTQQLTIEFTVSWGRA